MSTNGGACWFAYLYALGVTNANHLRNQPRREMFLVFGLRLLLQRGSVASEPVLQTKHDTYAVIPVFHGPRASRSEAPHQRGRSDGCGLWRGRW